MLTQKVQFNLKGDNKIGEILYWHGDCALVLVQEANLISKTSTSRTTEIVIENNEESYYVARKDITYLKST